MSGVTPNKGPVSGVAHSIADLASDLLEILELQVRLAGKDAKDVVRSGVFPSIALVIGLGLMIAALPILAFSMSTLLHIQSGLPEWAAELLVGTSMCLVASVLSLIAFRRLKESVSIFSRSTSELSKNIAWLKSVARQDENL